MVRVQQQQQQKFHFSFIACNKHIYTQKKQQNHRVTSERDREKELHNLGRRRKEMSKMIACYMRFAYFI